MRVLSNSGFLLHDDADNYLIIRQNPSFFSVGTSSSCSSEGGASGSVVQTCQGEGFPVPPETHQQLGSVSSVLQPHVHWVVLKMVRTLLLLRVIILFYCSLVVWSKLYAVAITQVSFWWGMCKKYQYFRWYFQCKEKMYLIPIYFQVLILDIFMRYFYIRSMI